MYQRLKKQNGEKFAQTIRNFHNGILEIENLDHILKYTGNDAEPLLPYLISLINKNDEKPIAKTQDPFTLLDQAGYKAFYADTLEKQNSLKQYFKQGELLCTFNDAARYQNYHIIHAVKKNADEFKREDFEGKELREDAYGTSVISIQMLKAGGFISIKNRYNHAVSGCDNTFNSNPDNIIEGLSASLKKHFNVNFSSSAGALPEDFVLMDNQVLKYHVEYGDVYYGDKAWATNGKIHTVNKSAGDAMFDGFLFDNKTKSLRNIDPNSSDSFPDDSNKVYGGNKALLVKDGNLMLNGEFLIKAEKSQIKEIYLPKLKELGDRSLINSHAITRFFAPQLRTMGNVCIRNAYALTHFIAQNLTTMGNDCFLNNTTIRRFYAPKLENVPNHLQKFTGSENAQSKNQQIRLTA